MFSSLAQRERAAGRLFPLPTLAQGKEGMKGRYFLLETDLREGLTLKLDKTSKSILVILRQLGRISEVNGGGVGVTKN